MAREKDDAIKIKVCILNKQNSSINFSIRLKDELTIEQVLQQINQFLKSKL